MSGRFANVAELIKILPKDRLKVILLRVSGYDIELRDSASNLDNVRRRVTTLHHLDVLSRQLVHFLYHHLDSTGEPCGDLKFKSTRVGKVMNKLITLVEILEDECSQ